MATKEVEFRLCAGHRDLFDHVMGNALTVVKLSILRLRRMNLPPQARELLGYIEDEAMRVDALRRHAVTCHRCSELEECRSSVIGASRN
ncbi:MAG: hypothetical protein KatS3mg015_2762 [Fimbriimonadales bacterium]|nr:MAG: hypothetical protein KatS3mg015_2762 [Fimbriimonadales bacterium]